MNRSLVAMSRRADAAPRPLARMAIMSMLGILLSVLGTSDRAQAQQPRPAAPNNRAASSDPFGGGNTGVQDPFGNGNGVAADPFGGDAGTTYNPFGNSRVPQKRRAKPGMVAASGMDKSANLEQWLRDQLQKEVSFNAVDQSLMEFAQMLSKQIQAPIVVDRNGLEEIGLTTNQAISLGLEHVSARSALRLALRELGLTYTIKHEVIMITTPEVAEANLTVKAYDLSPALRDKGDKVIRALMTTVKPSTWEVSGGPSAASTIDDVLLISANESVHDAVADFLRKVEAVMAKRGKR